MVTWYTIGAKTWENRSSQSKSVRLFQVPQQAASNHVIGSQSSLKWSEYVIRKQQCLHLNNHADDGADSEIGDDDEDGGNDDSDDDDDVVVFCCC